MATLSVPCASGDKAPSDMPGVMKRLRSDVMLSTSSSGIASRVERKSSRSRSWIGARLLVASVYFLKVG